MKKVIFTTLLVSGINFAGTGLNCNEVHEMKSNEIKQCVEQTDNELNANYKELMTRYKELKHITTELKNAQRTWLKYRDAECGYHLALGSASSAHEDTLNACMVTMTIQRNEMFEEYLK